MQAIRACVAATVRRDLKEPVAPVERSHEERVTFRWRRFLLLTYLVVTASTAQLCLMTQDEIRERKLREAQETRNRLRSAESGTTSCGEEMKIPQPETFTHSDPSDQRSRFGSVQRVMRISDCPHPIEQSVSRECISGMDDVSVMWSPLESKDGPGRHSVEDGSDNRTISVDTLPAQDVHQRRDYNRWQTKRRHSSDAVGFLCAKEWCTHPHTMESRVSPSTHSCSAAQPMAEHVMVLDSDSMGSEESFTMLNVPAESAVTPQEQQFLLKQLLHLSSSGITGQEARRTIVRMFPDQQQKINVSKAVRTLQDTMQKI